jgi:hypothetical protein
VLFVPSTGAVLGLPLFPAVSKVVSLSLSLLNRTPIDFFSFIPFVEVEFPTPLLEEEEEEEEERVGELNFD